MPVDGRALRSAVGVRPVAPGEWLLPGDDRTDQLDRKRELLTSRPAEVLAALPGSEAACEEVLGLVLKELDTCELDGHASLRGAAALRRAAELVQEDLCVMIPVGDSWILAAGCVCFPSHWTLAEKLGTSLLDIHAPVPGYRDRLAAATDGVFDRIARDPTLVLSRFNATLATNENLFQPGPGEVVTLTPAEVGERVWLRVERQTLRGLPSCGAAVFTIRTFLTPLASLDARERSALAGSLAGVSPELLRYRGQVGYFGAVKQWLAHGAGV